jgi:thioredoxin 1
MASLFSWKKTTEEEHLEIELNRDNYEAETLKSDLPVLVDFWGPQCRPCLALMPAIEELSRNYTGRLKVGKVNAVQNRMLCARLRVIGLPTFILYKNGAEIKRLTGEDIKIGEIKIAMEAMLD